MDCTVTLHAPTLSSILLSFTRLELEHCATMEIYDGFGESADLLALFTGSVPAGHGVSAAGYGNPSGDDGC